MRVRIHLVLLSVWTCVLLNPGNLGTVDTVRRLQVTRWIWRGEPPVRPDDPGAGVVGRNGVRHPPYGIGQSLVMLPFDIFANAVIGPVLKRFNLDASRQAQIVELALAFLMQSFLTACALLLAYELLRTLRFSTGTSATGALALLFATTVLQYVQCAQENLLLLALALATLYAVRRYVGDPGIQWAAAAGLASSLALLTRLTSVLETGVLGIYALACTSQRKRFLAGFAAPIAAALLFDRWYQYYRFGEIFSTYTGIVERQFRPAGAPEKFLFSYPFWKGFLGALFSPDKSVLLFDPLLALSLVLVAWNWRALERQLRLLLGALVLLLGMYLTFYAKYYFFGGGVAWGDRYVLLPVQLFCLFAVPLLLASPRPLPQSLRRGLWTFVIASVVIQASSTIIAANLEVMQRERGYPGGAIWNRAINLIQISTGREDPQRFAGIPVEWRTLYYFPFQLRFRFPALAPWAIAGWLALIVVLPVLILTALRAARAPAVRASPEVASTARIP
ncbi:MAG TPA: glycosyltransferase 87 family protein [Bryobacteraceae bacterium]|nr:glycosyltransferase 87 family protein [Bryobacteraceae bacterium]